MLGGGRRCVGGMPLWFGSINSPDHPPTHYPHHLPLSIHLSFLLYLISSPSLVSSPHFFAPHTRAPAMPTESLAEPAGAPGSSNGALPPPAALKCASCGAASLGPTDGVIILGEQIERVCTACVRAGDAIAPASFDTGVSDSSPPSPTTLGLGLTGLTVSNPRDSAVVIDLASVARLRSPTRCRRSSSTTESSNEHAPVAPDASPSSSSEPLPDPSAPAPEVSASSSCPAQAIPVPQRVPEPVLQAKSLPAARTSPWATVSKPAAVNPAPAPTPSPPIPTDIAPNPLLDVGRARVRSESRGCLYPGSVFKGTQRSGRSAYDVEIRLVDVNFANWTVCGYLTIANLTDTHPELTTFFDGEIIGPKYGFITGQRFGATEVDDRRHWERFEQFLRPSTKADIVRPEMLLRDPLPNISRGETQPRERDFVFLRIKEKFLVPDHTVRDISGASFAGEWGGRAGGES